MKLPLSAVRAALKLQSPAQRLYWALCQYESGLNPTPAVVANLANGVPANPAGLGLDVSITKNFVDVANTVYFSLNEQPKHYDFQIEMLLNNDLLARGLDISKCFRETSLDLIQPYAGVIPADLAAAVDASTATTLEQYIYENWLALKADRTNNPITIAGATLSAHFFTKTFEDIYSTDYISSYKASITLFGSLPKRKALGDFNDYQLNRTPWDVVSFAGYAAS
jgi:hypothetical protein